MRARLDVGCLATLVALGMLGASCSDADKDFDPDEDPGSVRGVIRSGTADYFDEGRSEKVFALQKKDGSLVKLEGFNGAIIGGAAGAVIAVALLSGVLPARRAASVNPVNALKAD